jgi:hypothetical protein
MPYFTPDDFRINPSEFVNSCSKQEIEELIEALLDDGHLAGNGLRKSTTQISLNEEIFLEALDKISDRYLNLTLENEELIIKIANRL